MSYKLRSRAVLAMVACAAVLVSHRADAHGGFWRAYEILFEPSNPKHIVLRSDVWSLIETHDGGHTWQWVCSELYRSKSGNAGNKLSMALLAGGSLLVANNFEGLRRRGADVCDEWPAVGDFAGEWLPKDVVKLDEQGNRILVVATRATGTGGLETQLFESSDGAETFQEFGAPLPANFSGTSVKVAPSEDARVYVSGKSTIDLRGLVARSSDSGATWDVSELPIDDPNWAPRLAAVDPTRPDVVYFWMDNDEAGGGDVQPDSVWLSKDGGVNWELLVDGIGNLPGFALSPDGSRVLVSGPEDGIWGADVTELLDVGSAAFEQVFTGRVWGLNWRPEGLYAGTNDFTPAGIEPFSLAISQDGGRTFEPFFVICATQLLDCAPESFGALVCPSAFSDPNGEGQFKEDFLDSQRCQERGAPDAGGVDAGPLEEAGAVADADIAPITRSGGGTSVSGCGCRMHRLPGSPAASALAVVGLMAALRRWRTGRSRGS